MEIRTRERSVRSQNWKLQQDPGNEDISLTITEIAMEKISFREDGQMLLFDA